MISRYTVEVPDDFDIIKSIEKYETIEAQVERFITRSLFWDMLYSAINSGHSKGQMFLDVAPDATTAYVKGNGFLSLRRHCFCIPSPGATRDPKKQYVRLFIEVVWSSWEEEFGESRNHMIDVPVELFYTKSKQKINGWIQAQRKWVKDHNDKKAKEEAEEYVNGNPEVLKHLLKLAKVKK